MANTSQSAPKSAPSRRGTSPRKKAAPKTAAKPAAPKPAEPAGLRIERRAAFTVGNGVAIYGTRNGGKSTLAKRLVKEADYAFIMTIDCTDRWAGEVPGVRIASMNGLAKAMNQGARIVHIGSRPDAICRDADAAVGKLFERHAPIIQARKDGSLPDDQGPRALLVIDEANWVIAQRLEAAVPNLMQAVLQGRHANIDFCLITQRPALISKNLRSQAVLQCAFRMEDRDDIDAVASRVTGGKDAFANLPEFHAICTEKGQSWIEPSR